MALLRIGRAKLASLVLAGGIASTAAVAPALLPESGGGSVARAHAVLEIDYFDDVLSPYGDWVVVPRYGRVWHPVGLHPGWRPYYDDGHWAYSDEYGWLWVSDLPWGWAPFHYGRWVFIDYHGWVWVPGRVWGPAWVTFRYGPDVIGWAPLPPEAVWHPRYGVRYDDEPDPIYWSFVRPEGFLHFDFDRYAYDRRDHRHFVERTTNVTNITIVNNIIVNRSIDVDFVERTTHRRVKRVEVAESDRPGRMERRGSRIVMFKPAVVEHDETEPRVTDDRAAAEQPQAKRKKRRIEDFGQPTRQVAAPTDAEPSVLDDAPGEPQQRKKRKRRSLDIEQGGQPPEFFAPTEAAPSADGDQPAERPAKRKKKRRSLDIEQGGQPEFLAPTEMAPSAGVEDQQPQKKKKKRRILEQGTPPEFFAPTVVEPSAGGAAEVEPQPQKKRKKRSNVVSDDGPQAPAIVEPSDAQSPDGEDVTPRKKKQKKCKGGAGEAGCGDD
jgi:hypothetical protein